MSYSTISLTIIFSWIVLTLLIGVLAGIKKKFSLDGYLVSNRSMGFIFLYVLLAGEIYSAYAFLGVAGWAYSYGLPIMYAFGYGTLAYAFGYFFAEYIWRAGKKFSFVTQADYFRKRYNSKGLAVLVALIGIVFNVPYLQLQLQGLGYILHATSFGSISVNTGIVVGMLIMLAYVYTSGLRGIAWTNLMQSIMMFVIAWVILFSIPFIKFGGISEMMKHLAQVKPHHLILSGKMGVSWYISTMVLSGLGFFMYPQMWPSIYSSNSLRALKKTYVFLPLFSIFLLPIFLAGASVAAAGIHLGRADEAVLTAVTMVYPKWVLGIVGAAGFAAAASTASAIILTLAGLLSKNLYGMFKENASDKELVLVSRISVLIFGLAAMFLALFAGGRLVALLLLAYSGITQMFPGAFMGLFFKRFNKVAVTSGLIAGLITITYLKFFGPGNLLGIHFGLWGLLVNVIITFAISAVSKEDENFRPFKKALQSVEV
ncbi:MAG: sodium:solute symporter family protein [Synergistetes bacterium]|nr:sodium:solute symporter family protein [Synergistota bacterium]